jgi:SUKH-3 immunity protein of toxin-antitoxin system
MPDRFPAQVEEVLRAAGWSEGRRTDAEAAMAVDMVRQQVGRNGERSEPFDAATAVLNEFGGVYVIQDGPGVHLRRRPFAIDPTDGAATTETLADLGKRLRTRLFPIGMEGDHDSILAVDEAGKVYAIDHTGTWLLGDSIDAALVTLVTGTQPSRLNS